MGLGDLLRLAKLRSAWHKLVRLWQAPGPWEGKMKGMRTILLSALGLVAALLQAKGIVLPQNDQAALAEAIMSLAFLYQRFQTNAPVTWSSSTLVVVLVGLLATAAQVFGVTVPLDHQAALATGVQTVLGLVLRLRTTTPVGQSFQDRAVDRMPG